MSLSGFQQSEMGDFLFGLSPLKNGFMTFCNFEPDLGASFHCTDKWLLFFSLCRSIWEMFNWKWNVINYKNSTTFLELREIEGIRRKFEIFFFRNFNKIQENFEQKNSFWQKLMVFFQKFQKIFVDFDGFETFTDFQRISGFSGIIFGNLCGIWWNFTRFFELRRKKVDIFRKICLFFNNSSFIICFCLILLAFWSDCLPFGHEK